MINQDKREEFKEFCSDKVKIPNIVRVLLSSRLSNNPLLYTKTTAIDKDLTEKFGRLSATDLNALEMTLLQHRHDTFAYRILLLLKRYATREECKLFLNHQWGNQGNTALHLASFWGMSRLVRLMLDLGADPWLQNNLQMAPVDFSTDLEVTSMLEPVKCSILLKKAMIVSSEPQLMPPSEDYFLKPSASPLSFSSSSSSSSSSFSLDPWTPSLPIQKSDPDLLSIHQGLDSLDILPQTILPLKKNSQLIQEALPQIELLPNQDVITLPPQQKKHVHFDSRIILIDCCVTGDIKELLDWINSDLNDINDSQNRSLLHIALMNGNEHLVDSLIDKVDINKKDQDGWTCLHYSAALGLWKSLTKLASIPLADLQAKTCHGLKIEDCPNSNFGRRKCKSILDKARCK